MCLGVRNQWTNLKEWGVLISVLGLIDDYNLLLMTELKQKKVVLLGNTAVGKTSIFNRVINDTYI